MNYKDLMTKASSGDFSPQFILNKAFHNANSLKNERGVIIHDIGRLEEEREFILDEVKEKIRERKNMAIDMEEALAPYYTSDNIELQIRGEEEAQEWGAQLDMLDEEIQELRYKIYCIDEEIRTKELRLKVIQENL